MTPGRPHAGAPPRAGFTMIELIVTLVLLGVVVGAVAPRFTGAARRRAEARVERAAALFEAAARRQTIGGRAAAIEYDAETHALTLTTRTAEVRRRDIQRERDFSDDLLSAPAPLEELVIDELSIGGRPPRDDESWRITFDAIGARPEVRLTLRGQPRSIAARRWLILVPPAGAGVRIQPLDEGERPAQGVAEGFLDLDARGVGELPW